MATAKSAEAPGMQPRQTTCLEEPSPYRVTSSQPPRASSRPACVPIQKSHQQEAERPRFARFVLFVQVFLKVQIISYCWVRRSRHIICKPPLSSTARWLPLTLTKEGGGNLGSSIQSIAIYTDSVAPTASSNILVDNFIACTTSGLCLQSLISKNSAAQEELEGFYAIQSIVGTTIILDGDTNAKSNSTWNVYFRLNRNS